MFQNFPTIRVFLVAYALVMLALFATGYLGQFTDWVGIQLGEEPVVYDMDALNEQLAADLAATR